MLYIFHTIGHSGFDSQLGPVSSQSGASEGIWDNPSTGQPAFESSSGNSKTRLRGPADLSGVFEGFSTCAWIFHIS